MRFRPLYLVIPFLALVALALVGYSSDTPNSHFDERVKVALRDAGNQLLLANQDRTSLVMPVVSVGALRYELSFGTDIYLEPSTLVQYIDKSMTTAQLPLDYITEVRECATREVAYSYQNSKRVTDQIVPCAGRELPLNCYTIQVIFTKPQDTLIPYKHYPLYSLILVGFIGVGLVYQSKSKAAITQPDNNPYTTLGVFKFYTEQHQLLYHDTMIPLTIKECELLQLFSEQPNTVIKREFLIKTVWEDQGVFVGRSLDTYISKLRKKLSLDPNISLVNVHGVGYRLELVDMV
ncbi:MAG: winged helix-turn-helix domain-containing protein [Gelidibacter sp.]